MHSWRVLILPFMEETALYNQYDFREPWDGPNNIKLLNRMPLLFSCPSRFSNPTNLTSFVVITGPGTMFPGAASVKFADVTDGRARTLMMVEVENQDIPWTAPVDLDVRTMSLKVNDPGVPSISSMHPDGAHICLFQRRQFLRENVSADAAACLDHDRRPRWGGVRRWFAGVLIARGDEHAKEWIHHRRDRLPRAPGIRPEFCADGPRSSAWIPPRRPGHSPTSGSRCLARGTRT